MTWHALIDSQHEQQSAVQAVKRSPPEHLTMNHSHVADATAETPHSLVDIKTPYTSLPATAKSSTLKHK